MIEFSPWASAIETDRKSSVARVARCGRQAAAPANPCLQAYRGGLTYPALGLCSRRRRRPISLRTRTGNALRAVAASQMTAPHSSKRAALAELVELTRSAGAPLASNEIPGGLYNVLLHHFGGIHRARVASNLPDPPSPKRWSEAEVIAELRRFHESGVTIRVRDLELCGREDLVGAIRVEIGSIVRARRLARIPSRSRLAMERRRVDVLLRQVIAARAAPVQ